MKLLAVIVMGIAIATGEALWINNIFAAPTSAELVRGCVRHGGITEVSQTPIGPMVIVCRDGKVWQR